MSLDNFRNRTIIWDTVNKDFPQPIQIMKGDVNARTLLIKIVDNGIEIDLTGHSLKLTYQYTNSSNSGFVMIPPNNLTKGEFILVIPTEMTETGVIEANLILLNESLEQVIVSKNLTFISDNSTVTGLAQEVNNKIDDFTKLLLENMPQVMRSELNDLHAQIESNKSNIELKAEQSDLSTTNKNVTTAQETANKAESEAKNAMAKATEAQANSLPLNSNAVSASKLATARKLGVNLQSSSFQYFDGTADATDIGVSGVLPIEHGGTSTSDGVINTTAYSNSADGTDDFTTVYPNLNLLTDSKDFKNKNVAETVVTTSITSPDSTIVKEGNDTYLHFVRPRYEGGDWPQDWLKAYLIRDSSVSPNFPNVDVKPNSQYTFSVWLKGTGEHAIIAYNNWTIPNPTTLTVNLTNTWTKYILTVNTATNITTNEARFFIRSENVGTEINLKYPKVEEGSIATPWMPSASEVTTADYPKYVGFSNSIKPNKKSSDYKWLPMGLVSIDRATGLLKPAVMGIDYAQAHPVGSVVTNTSSSSSGYSTGKWENIGSAVIGSTTIYYWKRTA